MVARNERLTVSLPSDREIVMSRGFDAPRKLVFETHVRCEHLKRWWGQRGSTLSVCDVDLRPGGAWRFVERQEDGAEHGFHGIYREIVPPERLSYTFEYEGLPGHVAVETVTFVEEGGRTIVTARMLFESKEDRDGMVQSGMETGANEIYDRLAELLETLVEPARR